MLKYAYYHSRIKSALRFIILPGKRILLYGFHDGQLLHELSPKPGYGIDPHPQICKISKREFPDQTIVCTAFAKYRPAATFDYVILNGALGKTDDIMRLFQQIQRACHPLSRVIVYQHNHLWQGILTLAESLGLKRKEGVHNWLSITDVKLYLSAAGFETTRVFRKTLLPLYLVGLGPLVNWLSNLIPILDLFKLDQFIVARPISTVFTKPVSLSLSICITVRDEKDNIEPIVKAIPSIARVQEILFVEGHSQDGTREEIKRVARQFPGKHIRLLSQPGFGQADAIRVGFRHTKGDIIILFEGDGTGEALDIPYFYEALNSHRYEFVEGSRFVYPLSLQSMPFIKRLGNMLFAFWFSFFLGQSTTDVLSGVKAISKKHFNLVDMRWGELGITDPFGDFELLFNAARMGLKVGEIPVHYRPRSYGVSKTKVLTHGWYLVRMALKGYLFFRQ